MAEEDNYLKRELYALLKRDDTVFEFLQLGSLDGIWYWDLEQPENEWLSPRFWEILGYDPSHKQHLSSEWQELIHQDDLTLALDNLAKHCQDPGHPYDQIVRYRHKDGSTVWVRCRGTVIRNAAGEPHRLLGAHTDLTLLKRTEERLRLRTRELEAANAKLEMASERIRLLERILPICSYCKKIQDDSDHWHEIDPYISQQVGTEFSHGICPDCLAEFRTENRR